MMRLHHIGLVVPDVEAWIEKMGDLFGLKAAGEPIVDPVRQIRVALVETGSDVMLELIEPAGEDSPVAPFLASGGGVNHLGYTVEAMEPALEHLRDQGCLVMSPPEPAVAFQGCRAALLYTRDHELVELVEGCTRRQS